MHHLSVFALAAAYLAGGVSASGDHGHPEYRGLYSLGVGGSYTLELGGEGDEASIEFMVVPSSSADLEGLEEAEEASATAWEEFFSGSEAPASLPDGSSAIPSRSVVYTASLVAGSGSGGSSSSASTTTATTTDQQAVVAVVPLAVPAAGAYTLLLNHGEIPAAVVSPAGETLVPVVSESEDHHDAHEDEEDEDEDEDEEEGTGSITASQWANALAASFLISLCSFVGIITVVSSRVARKIDLSLAFLFASGALLTTAVVHIIPDAMDGLAPEYADDLHGLFLRSSIAVMAGIFGGFLLHVVLDNGHGGGVGGVGGHSHSPSALLHPLAGGRPPRGDTYAATPPVGSEEASFASSAAGNGNPAGAAAAAKTVVAVEAPSSSISDGNECRCGLGDSGQAVGATPCRQSQGTKTEACGEEDEEENGSRGCDGDGGKMEEGRKQRQQQHRPSDPSSEAEVAVRARTPATAARSSFPEEEAGEPGAVLTAGMLVSSLHDVKRLGADRGLFDVAGLDPVCWNVIFGDLAHNFSDGVTMGAAFLGCSPTVGWTITAANMMHEIPHEVGNFMALVNGGMSVKQALLYNFFSALFAVFGVVLTFSLRDVITQTAISYLLLLGAGTFIFVGLSELVPDALSSSSSSSGSVSTYATAARGSVEGAASSDADEKMKKKKKQSLHRRSQARKALAFTVGAVLLGLPLLTHRHCEAGGDHGHEHR